VAPGLREHPFSRPVIDRGRDKTMQAAKGLSASGNHDLLSCNVVAKRLGVSSETVRRWCREKYLSGLVQQTPGGHYRIPRAVCEALLRGELRSTTRPANDTASDAPPADTDAKPRAATR